MEETILRRQTHLVAAILLWTALLLSWTIDVRWIYLAILPGFGLVLDAATGFCPMTWILSHAPWNRRLAHPARM